MPAGLLVVLLFAADAGAPAPKYTREEALARIKAGHFADGANIMREVSHDPTLTPEARSSAAAITVNAYGRAFEVAADRRAAAELLCRGLAVADEFMQIGGAAASQVRPGRDRLLALRQPFGPCPPPATSELLPVSGERRRPPQPPPSIAGPEPLPEPQGPPPQPAPPRDRRALLISGAVLTGVGVGLVAASAAAVGVHLHQTTRMNGIFDEARANDSLTEPQRVEVDRLLAAGERSKAAAIGAGAAGAVSLATGIALLAVHRKTTRKFDVLPQGGPRGAGVVLHLRF